MTELVEIIYDGDPMFTMANGENIQVHAGTFVVLPSAWCNQQDSAMYGEFPDFLLVCEGQELRRDGYPGWSAEYPGGFYDFNLPNLKDKFIVGFDEFGTAIKGTGCVYYKDVPEIPKPPSQNVLD